MTEHPSFLSRSLNQTADGLDTLANKKISPENLTLVAAAYAAMSLLYALGAGYKESGELDGRNGWESYLVYFAPLLAGAIMVLADAMLVEGQPLGSRLQEGVARLVDAERIFDQGQLEKLRLQQYNQKIANPDFQAEIASLGGNTDSLRPYTDYEIATKVREELHYFDTPISSTVLPLIAKGLRKLG